MKRKPGGDVLPARAKAGRRKAVRGKSPRNRKAASREKVRAYRKRMRARGFRPVQLWLPDTRSPKLRALAHQAALAIASSPAEADDQAFIDSVQWWTSQEAENLAKREPVRWWKERPD